MKKCSEYHTFSYFLNFPQFVTPMWQLLCLPSWEDPTNLDTLNRMRSASWQKNRKGVATLKRHQWFLSALSRLYFWETYVRLCWTARIILSTSLLRKRNMATSPFFLGVDWQFWRFWGDLASTNPPQSTGACPLRHWNVWWYTTWAWSGPWNPPRMWLELEGQFLGRWKPARYRRPMTSCQIFLNLLHFQCKKGNKIKWYYICIYIYIYESWAKDPWKGLPLRRTLGM